MKNYTSKNRTLTDRVKKLFKTDYDDYELKATKIFVSVFIILVLVDFLSINEKISDVAEILVFFSGNLFGIILFERSKKLRKQIESQKHLIEEKQKEILDSIHYAKRLQEAILPPLTFIDEHVPNNFVLYQPKDVVAGDFYWAESKDNKFFIAAADCTSHGVPGAMVSVVCSNALNSVTYSPMAMRINLADQKAKNSCISN